jgi:hypothetical protein
MPTTPSWSTLLDAHGPATTKPDLLADLCAPSAEKRRRAREELYDRYVTDEPVSGLPEVVKALVQVAFDERTVEVSANIRLLVDLVMVDPDVYLREPFAGAKAVNTMGELERAAYHAFLELQLGSSLTAPDPELRAITALALSFVVEPDGESLGHLERLAASDPVEEVRISALLALARIGRHGSPGLRTAVSRLSARVGGAPGAIARFLVGEELGHAALVELATALSAPPRARESLPWANGDLADVASAILRGEGERARAVAPLVVDAVEKESDRAQLRDADLALHLLMPEHADTKRTLAAIDLSQEQRSALERMARANANARYRRYGLPENPAQLLRLLAPSGDRSARPIEQQIELPGKGSRATWQWFIALFAKEVDRDSLLAALRARFTPAELLAVLRDATRGAWDTPMPPMALIFDAVRHTGDDLTAYLDLADETLALAPVAGPPAALLATLPLVQRGRIDEKYDPLYTRVFRGNDKAIVAEFEKLLPAEVAARVKPRPKPR